MIFLLRSVFLMLAFVPLVEASSSALWQPISIQHKSASGVSAMQGQQYRVDTSQLRQVLSRSGHEGRASSASEITLPVENGEIQRFTLVESPVMAAGLAARYPNIKTYKVYGIDNPHASGRLSISPKGFHGMVSSPSGTLYIDPHRDDVYRSYGRKSQHMPQTFSCGVKGHDHGDIATAARLSPRTARRTAGSLRVYRLAVAATAEYVAAVGNSVADAQAEIVIAINRVNQIYERDLGIRLQIIARNDELIYQNPATDPYTNNDGATMLGQNQSNIDDVIGTGGYDIGHVFSTDGGGIASVGSVCSASFKAQGVTGLNNPQGENFYIDFVAHEIGHQFSAEHSFNGTTESCSSGRVQNAAFEPGSGSTIMSYAGICGTENITFDTDAVFNAGSISQIDTFTTTGNGSACGTVVAIDNPNEPVANAGNDVTIPHRTPFVLTAAGSDLDNDPLDFTWDQLDAGAATTSPTLGFDLGDNSLFRSYLPRPQSFRNFPALGTTLRNEFDDSEVLPCQSRALNFRLTVRDGKSGLAQDDVRITVDNHSGPFRINSFNTAQTISAGANTLTWDVAGTDQPPVSCSEVDISLLTFNSAKTTYFETVLAAQIPNDGSADIDVPGQFSNRARFKLKCSNNIFYDVSDNDLIIAGTPAFPTQGTPVFYNSGGLVTFPVEAEECIAGSSPVTVDPGPVATTSSGGGSVNPYGLLCLLFSVIGIRISRRYRKR